MEDNNETGLLNHEPQKNDLVKPSLPAGLNPLSCLGSLVKKEHGIIDPHKLGRDPDHERIFDYKTVTEFEGLMQSYSQNGKILPVMVVEDPSGLTEGLVIDGWKAREHAIATGLPSLHICRLTFPDNETKINVMVQLQMSEHTSFWALYKILTAVWPRHQHGRGYRADLLDESKPDGKDRRPDIYERVSMDLGIKASKVKQIKKIGDVNPYYFDLIEKGKHTLTSACNECRKEEKGEEAAVPKVKVPTYHTTSTSVPVFSNDVSISSEVYQVDEGFSTPGGREQQSSQGTDEPDIVHTVSGTRPTYILRKLEDAIELTITCPHCGESFCITIDKSELI